MLRPLLVWGTLSITTLTGGSVSAAPRVETFLTEGRLADGERELSAHLKSQPADDEARFGLGALQFVRGVEHLAQSLHQFGALSERSRLASAFPLLRLPIPENPSPERVRYADVRRMLQNLIDDLAKAEATLAGVKDKSVRLPLHFGQIRLDINGDGKTQEDEVLWRIYAQINRGAGIDVEGFARAADAFVIGFDYADVLWLRGYCHLLSSLAETMLLYDMQSLFDAVAHQFFANPDVPVLPAGVAIESSRWESDIADAIAAIHLMKFPVKEKQRGKAALEHLQAVVDLSRRTWKAVAAEEDDDHEWVPSPKQTGVIPNVRVTQTMVDSWHTMLDEAEAVLAGERLVPHWRMNAEHGVNLRKVFLEPREFDLVMWVHGGGVLPFVEKGPRTEPATWQQIQNTFGGNFIGFAVWFN